MREQGVHFRPASVFGGCDILTTNGKPFGWAGDTVLVLNDWPGGDTDLATMMAHTAGLPIDLRRDMSTFSIRWFLLARGGLRAVIHRNSTCAGRLRTDREPEKLGTHLSPFCRQYNTDLYFCLAVFSATPPCR